MPSDSARRKVATFLLSLDAEAAGKILKALPEDLVTEVSKTLIALEEVEEPESDRVLKEFLMKIRTGGERLVPYRRPQLEDMLRPVLGESKSQEVVERLHKSMESDTAFASLLRKDPTSLAEVLQKESPQTVAVILANLDPEAAGPVLDLMSAGFRGEVVRRMLNVEGVPKDVLEEMEAIVSEKAQDRILGGQEEEFEVAPVKKIADLLGYSGIDTEREILGQLSESDPESVQQIRKEMFVFEDVSKVPDRALQKILGTVAGQTLALALKTASESLAEKIFKNMSKRGVELVKEEMEMMGPKGVEEIEEAQEEILSIVRQLVEDGEVTLPRKGEKQKEAKMS